METEEIRYKRFGHVYDENKGWWAVELFVQYNLNDNLIDKQKEMVRVTNEELARSILANWEERGWDTRATLVAVARGQ